MTKINKPKYKPKLKKPKTKKVLLRHHDSAV